MSYVGLANVDALVTMTIKDIGGGYMTLSYPDGNVLSVQPDGSNQTRPAGTDGPFEACRMVGDNLVLYDGRGDPLYQGKAYLRAFVE